MMVQQTVRRDFPVPPLSMLEIAAEADAVLEQAANEQSGGCPR